MSGQTPNQNPYSQPPHYENENQNPYSNPWGETQGQPPHSQEQSHNPFAAGSDQPPSHNPFNPPQDQPSHNPPSHTQQQYDAPPGLPPRRTGTDSALPQGQDRSHQVEVMQSYEMSRPQTEDEQNQAILEREFPKIDGSLIAAIYGDSGSLSATREMLQELSSGEGK